MDVESDFAAGCRRRWAVCETYLENIRDVVPGRTDCLTHYLEIDLLDSGETFHRLARLPDGLERRPMRLLVAVFDEREDATLRWIPWPPDMAGRLVRGGAA